MWAIAQRLNRKKWQNRRQNCPRTKNRAARRRQGWPRLDRIARWFTCPPVGACGRRGLHEGGAQVGMGRHTAMRTWPSVTGWRRSAIRAVSRIMGAGRCVGLPRRPAAPMRRASGPSLHRLPGGHAACIPSSSPRPVRLQFCRRFCQFFLFRRCAMAQSRRTVAAKAPPPSQAAR